MEINLVECIVGIEEFGALDVHIIPIFDGFGEKLFVVVEVYQQLVLIKCVNSCKIVHIDFDQFARFLNLTDIALEARVL